MTPPAEKVQSAGNSWTPPKGPFTRQGSKLFRGDGQQFAIAMAANEADWVLTRLNAAPAPSPQSEREAFEAWATQAGYDVGITGPDAGCWYYTSEPVRYSWLAWQAARAFLASPAWRASAGSAREDWMCDLHYSHGAEAAMALWAPTDDQALASARETFRLSMERRATDALRARAEAAHGASAGSAVVETIRARVWDETRGAYFLQDVPATHSAPPTLTEEERAAIEVAVSSVETGHNCSPHTMRVLVSAIRRLTS